MHIFNGFDELKAAVGKATAFLALDGAKLITGSVLHIDGGYHIID